MSELTLHPRLDKNVRYAPSGYGFVKGRGAMLVRTDRSRVEQIRLAIDRELSRLGCGTRKLKVREFDGAFYVNLWYLRGLEPVALLELLQSLPNRCGRRLAMSKVEKLEERVETGRMSLRAHISQISPRNRSEGKTASIESNCAQSPLIARWRAGFKKVPDHALRAAGGGAGRSQRQRLQGGTLND